jgi:magnesium-transporting ATPase (P-type)
MITGDHFKTALAIACLLNIVPTKKNKAEHSSSSSSSSSSEEEMKGSEEEEIDLKQYVLTGGQLDAMSKSDIVALSEPFPRVFARVSPENKLKIVNALKSRGEIVTMTGDVIKKFLFLFSFFIYFYFYFYFFIFYF